MEDYLYYFVMIVCCYIVSKIVNNYVNSYTKKSPKIVIVKTVGQTGNNETNVANVANQEITKLNDK